MLPAAAYQWLFKPLDQKVALAKADTVEKRQKLQDVAKKMSNAKELAAEVEELKKALDFCESKLPAEKDYNQVFDEVSKLAVKNGLTSKSVRLLKVVQAALTRDAGGNPADWRSWSGSVQWEARQLLLRPLVDQLPADLVESLRAALPAVVVDSVRGSIDPWMSAQLDRGTLGDLRVRLRSDDIALMLADAVASKAGASAGGLRFTRVSIDATS